MIRFSLVIQNEKGELLLCETADSCNNKCEFPGGEFKTNELPPFEIFIKNIQDAIIKDIAIDICDLQKLEMFLCEEPFFIHTVFSARIFSGYPKAIKYKKVYWTPIENIDQTCLNVYGLQVMQKVSECGYCHFLRQRREEINAFFYNYFSKAEENLAILDTLKKARKNNSLYLVAFKQEMIHLRASLIENAKLEKNITIQNYLRLYGRVDLAEQVDQLLQMKVKEDLSLRAMIKTTVDKFIAHYDEPSEKDKEIYDFCVSLFALDGKIPLRDFVQSLNGYIMSLIVQMWYDAGELGVLMSERRIEDRNVIIEHGRVSLSKITSALKT